MTESDSELEGYISSDGESDFDEADTRPSADKLGPSRATAVQARLGLRQLLCNQTRTMNWP